MEYAAVLKTRDLQDNTNFITVGTRERIRGMVDTCSYSLLAACVLYCTSESLYRTHVGYFSGTNYQIRENINSILINHFKASPDSRYQN